MPVGQFPEDICSLYEIREWKHASTILKYDFGSEWDDLISMLRSFRLKRSWIVESGGRKTKLAQWIDDYLGARDWVEKQFYTQITVDEDQRQSPTHKIDCFKNKVALEIEWNNKDPFFDRDLNNFRLLFDLRAIDVGIIMTRCDDLQIIFNRLDRGKSYGASTTHMSKLIPRIEGGGGAGCPLIAIGITSSLYDESE